MTFSEHIRNYFQVYSIILSWLLFGQYTPDIVTLVWAILTFLLIIRTGNYSKILISFITILIFSDSRLHMMQFAADAKIGFILILFAFVMMDPNGKIVDNRIFRYFLPFVLVALLGIVWAKEPFVAVQKSVSYGMLLLTIPSLYITAKERKLEVLSDLIHYFAIFLTIGLLILLVSPDSVTVVGRYSGFLGNPNGLGILLTAVGPLFVLNLKVKEHQSLSRAEILFLIVYFVTLLLTGSRTSIFAIFLFGIFYLVRNLSPWLTLTVFVLILVSYNSILASLPQISAFFGAEEYLRIDTLEEGSGRFIAWNFALNQLDEVFILGGGFGYTELVFKLHYFQLSSLGHQGNAHNSYLTLWLDTGLIGLSLFCLGLVRTVLRSLHNSRITLPIIYCLLFSAFFESWMAASLNPFMTLFLLLFTALAMSDDFRLEKVE